MENGAKFAGLSSYFTAYILVVGETCVLIVYLLGSFGADIRTKHQIIHVAGLAIMRHLMP